MKFAPLKIFVIAVCLALFASASFAVPPSEEVLQRLKDDGKYDAFVQMMTEARAKGVNAPSIDTDGQYKASFLKATDTARTLVILVDFPDKPYTSGLFVGQQSDFEQLLFSEGQIPTGSMREYYLESSYGQLVVGGDIAGWYTVSQNSDYYTNFCDGLHGFGDYPNNAQRLTEEALDLADADVDFSQYDVDGDGWVEGVFIVHAGTGYEETGNDCEIHSHKWGINSVQKDGVWISTYSMEPEESPTSGGLIPIGVFCHEFGHVLGLPDLYDYDYDSRGTGRWEIMSSGSYNNGSRTPAQFCGWSKYQLGWLDPIVVPVDAVNVEVPAVEWNPTVYRLWPNGVVGNEYFLVENKQNVGYDSYLPGSGLLICHIDDNASSNSDQWHPIVMIEQADGDFDLQYNTNSGDAADPYPGSGGVTAFDGSTTPNSFTYSGLQTGVAVWNISASDSIMTANFDVGSSSPYFRIMSYSFSDAAYGDGDGVPEAGESIQFMLNVQSEWSEAVNVEMGVSSDDNKLEFKYNVSSLGTMPAGIVVNNSGDPIEFDIPVDYQPRIDTFFLEFSVNGGEQKVTLPIEQNIGGVSILLVDDDAGDNIETYFSPLLYDKRITYERWDVSSSGGVSAAVLNHYDNVFWFTGDYQDAPMTTGDISALTSFLDGGGNLFLSGQGIAKQLATLDPGFLNAHLRAGYTSSQMIPFVLPNAGGAVLNEVDTLILQSYGSANNQTAPDHLTAQNGGIVEGNYYGSLDPAAISYEGAYKLVFLGFGFEGLGEDDFRFAKRSEILDSIMVFFGAWNPAPSYIFGDANADGFVNVGDAVYLISYVFRGGPEPDPLLAGDANGDCDSNVGDAVFIINYVFRDGPAPLGSCK